MDRIGNILAQMKMALQYFPIRRWLLLGALLGVVLAGCATFRADYPVAPSHAFDRPRETTLGKAYAQAESRHPGFSGFRLLNNGVSALLTRAALADLAERSIDVQYYIFDADDIGLFLMKRLIAAADRGVRVRIIIDDYLIGFDDATLARIDAHPNIEIRVFNPYPDRARWSRPLQMMFNLATLGNRMHNKLFAVDGQAAVMGGRNLSNHYFEGESETNFRDMDVLAAGPVVAAVLKQYDTYWNEPIVVPVAAFGADAGDGNAARAVEEAQAALSPTTAAGVGAQTEYQRRKAEFERRVLRGADELVWAAVRPVTEPPVRQLPGAAKPSAEVARALAIERQRTRGEFTMETAYFVPGERGVQVLSELTARGVRVRILTNSMASTDVPAVHSGYSRYREALLAAGVELYEYRVDAPRPIPSTQLLRFGRSDSALHAKVVVHDRRVVWIGTANFDPRSRRINTETGLLIESEALAARMLESMERDFSPAQSWRLVLETDAQTGMRRIVWVGEQDGAPLRLSFEPGAGVMRQLRVLFYSLLPGIEELL